MSGVIFYSLIVLISFLTARNIKGGVLSCGMEDRVKDRILLTALFFLLWLPAALRIYTGNDYSTYIEHFHDANVGNYVVTEEGFNLVVRGIYAFLDGEYFLVIFAVFSAVTVFFFLRALYEQSGYFAESFLLLMLFGLYFQTYNTVRYYMALSVLFWSLRFVQNRQYGKFVIAVFAAALFHKTALLVLPMYPVCRMKWGRYHYAALALLGISGLLFADRYMEIFIRLYPSYLNDPEALAGGGISIVNIIRCAAVLILCLSCGIKEGLYFNMNTAALVLYICFSFVPFLSRIGYLLGVSQLFLIPEAVQKINRKYVKGFIYAAAGLYFAVFLWKAFGETVKILPYHTWLTYGSEAFRVFKGI